MILHENTDSEVGLTGSSASRQNQRLADLEPLLQEHVRQSSWQRTFQTGATLFAQGARHTHTYMVEDGLVRTFYTASSGREITLAYWSKGDIIGGPNFFGEGYHCWSGVAARPTRTLAITGSKLRTLANRHPQISMWLTDVLIFKLRWMSVLLQLHGTESVQCRLAKLILMLGDIYGVSKGEEVVIKHRINQSDLATLVGASRQWTNKMLRDLQAEGLLYMRDRYITISAVSKLRQFVGEQFE